jgi:hypothetical protein
VIFDSNTSRVTSCGSAGAGRAPAMGVSTGLIPWSSFVGAGRGGSARTVRLPGVERLPIHASDRGVTLPGAELRTSTSTRVGRKERCGKFHRPPPGGRPPRARSASTTPRSWRNCGIRYARTKAPDRHAAYRPPPARNGATQAPTRGLRATRPRSVAFRAFGCRCVIAVHTDAPDA